MHFDKKESLWFQNAIVQWFKNNARDLPWRKTSDPYSIWISEMMLQQTTVATVIPYYQRFLIRYPNIHSLAKASEEDVLKLWEGLGYYRRAKNLLKAAQFVVEKYSGKFPDTKETLLEIPGIGPYSSGAILSIAFRKKAAALDGNLIRVYSRFFSILDDVTELKVLKGFWQIAEFLSPDEAENAREFAEGMMELGATVCTPRNPQCSVCPINKKCGALAQGIENDLPRKKVTAKRTKIYEEIFISEDGGRLAFLKKGGDPKYPDFSRLPFETLQAPKTSKPTMRYAVTNRDFLVWISFDLPKKIKSKIIWQKMEDLESLLLPAIDRKILKALPGILKQRANRHGAYTSGNRRHG